MRTIGVVTVARSDYGIYRPLLRGLMASRSLKLHLFVGGSHLWRSQGLTIKEIQADEVPIGTRVGTPEPGNTPESTARSLAACVDGFARAFANNRPDLLVVLGDRFDMFAAALAALPIKLPVAHLHGGELTLGAIDDALRHSMTKLSHLHFVSTRQYARRVRQLGEETWRVTVTGALALDNLTELNPTGASELSTRWSFNFAKPFLLVTLHPTTLDQQAPERQADVLLEAIQASGFPAVFTLANADPGGIAIMSRIKTFVAARHDCRLLESVGTRDYFGIMALASAMLGNSSSGLIEAPKFKLPVVNVGRRQDGRLRADNVLDAPFEVTALLRRIKKAASPRFRDSLRGMRNPHGNGGAARRILEKLQAVRIDERLIRKAFVDLPRSTT